MTNGTPHAADAADGVFDDEYYAPTDENARDRLVAERDDVVPEGIVSPWEWKEARRLRAVHRRTDDDPPRCRHCLQPWPCSGIQMAGLGEKRARGEKLPPTWLTWTQNAEDDPHGTGAGTRVTRVTRDIGRRRPGDV